MRPITEIIIHCTGTVPSPDTTVASVREYHIKHNGWKDIGYHYLIYTDGSIHQGRPIDQVGAHCSDHNSGTVGVCYVGGKNEAGELVDTRTVRQVAAIRQLVSALKVCFPTIKKVSGHYMYNKSKPCPCFDVAKEFGK